MWSAGTCSAIGRSRAFFLSLSLHRTPVPPIVLDRRTHMAMAMVRYGLRAVRFTRGGPVLLRSVPPVVERAREESSQASIYAASSSSAHQQTRAAQKAVVFPFRMNHIPSHPSPSQSTRPQAFEAGRSKRSPSCRYLVCMMTGSRRVRIHRAPMTARSRRWYLGTCKRQ